jgi:hypothetical protein
MNRLLRQIRKVIFGAHDCGPDCICWRLRRLLEKDNRKRG